VTANSPTINDWCSFIPADIRTMSAAQRLGLDNDVLALLKRLIFVMVDSPVFPVSDGHKRAREQCQEEERSVRALLGDRP